MKNALLVIDVQNIYTDSRYEYFVESADNIVDNINKIIKKFNENQDLIVYIKHQHKTDGSDTGRMFDYAGESSEIEFAEGSHCAEYTQNLIIVDAGHHIIKNRYDAFVNTGLSALLKTNRIEKVTIVGFMANFCCESTAKSAHDLDYYVDFVKDAVGTPGTELYDSNQVVDFVCDSISSGFGVVVETKDIIS